MPVPSDPEHKPLCIMQSDYTMSTTTVSSGVVHEIPEDLRTALLADLAALKLWESITPLARNEWICWVLGAKKQETRRNRIDRVISELKEGMRRPCCFPGCPHREKNGRSPLPPAVTDQCLAEPE